MEKVSWNTSASKCSFDQPYQNAHEFKFCEIFHTRTFKYDLMNTTSHLRRHLG
jgi:hypothetical protein